MKALFLAAIVHGVAWSPSVLAGDAGSHEALLVQALFANAAGECPAILMANDMKADCDRQLPAFKETLVKLGALRATSFQGTRALESGPAEVYRVSFEHGDMIWMIGTQDDGKIRVLWAPNAPEWNIGSFSRSNESRR